METHSFSVGDTCKTQLLPVLKYPEESPPGPSWTQLWVLILAFRIFLTSRSVVQCWGPSPKLLSPTEQPERAAVAYSGEGDGETARAFSSLCPTSGDKT